jgi:hypothetical protein
MSGIILCMEPKKMSKMKKKSRSKWSNGGAGGFGCPCCHKILPESKKMERRQLRRVSKALEWLNEAAEGPPLPHGFLASSEPFPPQSQHATRHVEASCHAEAEVLDHDASVPTGTPHDPSAGTPQIRCHPIDTPRADLKLPAAVRAAQKTLEGDNEHE